MKEKIGKLVSVRRNDKNIAEGIAKQYYPNEDEESIKHRKILVEVYLKGVHRGISTVGHNEVIYVTPEQWLEDYKKTRELLKKSAKR